MQLVMSSRKPWSASFSTSEGQVLYRSECPWALGTRTATIYKVIPSEVTPVVGGISMQDQFSKIGEVKFHLLSSSKITIGTNNYTSSTLFRRSGINLLGLGSDRVFTGPDGREYRWVMRQRKSELYLGDGNTLVAKYHFSHSGLIKEARPSSLEITAQGEHMIDWIIVTFVYIEKLRKDRERRNRGHGGGGGGGGGDGGG
ncbi:hypothetical protein FA15DRAFT_669378 [Coprinopsis marcescibilis]|uniref:DUF6593 domain-containing protein n=1 Tax=Coprinopsis marcescibilis TaxID=230819 RepID=A0A5C3KVF5_COPMA|nr:hypothetical protein FA15DRAFT_669378 [Coprinopsis marcescibilis]